MTLSITTLSAKVFRVTTQFLCFALVTLTFIICIVYSPWVLEKRCYAKVENQCIEKTPPHFSKLG